MILKTDLYQLTMLAAQFKKGLHKKVVSCEAFARKMPKTRKFLVMAGTEEINNFLLNMRFEKDDISYLKSLDALRPVFNTSNFEEYLRDFSFTGDFWALAEGEVAFAGEPLIRVTAPLPQAHLAETFGLSVLNHDIRTASKAARIVLAARGRPVLEFGTRRTHHEAATNVARSAYLAGFSATSNLAAGQRYNIPVAGTMAHMWVMIHDNEQQAFENFRDVYSEPVLLVDTYDTLEGVRKAARIPKVKAVRLDSRDLGQLARGSRKILDKAGRGDVKIIASNDLNEYKIDSLADTPIDAFGVGTELALSPDAPSLGIVYKAVYDEECDRPLIKISPGKTTLPGRKQVFLDTRNGNWSHLVALEGAVKPRPELTPLMDCYIQDGQVANEVASLEVARRYCNGCLLNLHNNLAGLEESDTQAPVIPHESLKELFERAANEQQRS